MLKAQRKSNIELLRIICMLLIVIHHFLVHGNLWTMPPSINKDIVNFFVPFGKICFDAFLAISCWFLVKSSFKGDRFLKTWIQVLFYNVVFTIAARLMGDGSVYIGGRVLLGSLLPMIGNSHGFAAAYLIFYLTIPLLKKIQEGLNKRQTLYVLALLGMTQVFTPSVGNLIGYTQPQQSEFLLFVFVYFVAYYLQKWPIKLLKSTPFLISSATVLIAVIVANNMVAEYHNHIIIDVIRALTLSEFGILNIVAGFLLFLLFDQLDISHSNTINLCATSTFGILLMHDHNYFRSVVWQDFKTMFDWGSVNPLVFLAMTFVISGCIFVIGMTLDLLRQCLIERPLMNTQFVRKIAALVENFTDMVNKTENTSDK